MLASAHQNATDVLSAVRSSPGKYSASTEHALSSRLARVPPVILRNRLRGGWRVLATESEGTEREPLWDGSGLIYGLSGVSESDSQRLDGHSLLQMYEMNTAHGIMHGLWRAGVTFGEKLNFDLRFY